MSPQQLAADARVEHALKAGVARVLRGTDPDFDDALQDGWVILLRSREIRAPVSLAFHVGRTAALEIMRRRARTRDCIDLDEVPPVADPGSAAPAPLLRGRLRQAISSLPTGQRHTFVRTAMLGYSLAEVARRTGRHPGSVRSQAWKARNSLREALAGLRPESSGRSPNGNARDQ